MRYKNAVPDKFKELWKYHINSRRTHDHLIGDACQVRDLKRDRPPRIYKSTEPVHDPAVYDFYSADLYDPVADRTKSGCLNVKDNVCIIQCLIPGIHCNICQVIHYISFYPIEYFERIVLIESLNIMVRVRECLCHTVIRDSDRGMAPVMGALYDILHLGDSVHIAHLCMAVKLHTFDRTQILS